MSETPNITHAEITSISLRMPVHMLPQTARVVDLVPGSGRWTKNGKHLIALVALDGKKREVWR